MRMKDTEKLNKKTEEMDHKIQPKTIDLGAQVAEWLARRPLSNAARVRFLAGDLIPAP